MSSNNDREALARISANLLVEILSAARQHKGLYEQLGISQETFADLSRLSIAELYQIADGSFIGFNIDDRMLKLARPKTPCIHATANNCSMMHCAWALHVLSCIST